MHPEFNFSQAVGQGEEGGGSDGVCGDVELDVISVAVEAETVMTNDFSYW